MLSVVIETQGDAEALTRTLASLVTGAVEGAVREVIVCDPSGEDMIREVADLTGCRYISRDGVTAGIAIARSDWIVMLEPGVRLLDGWVDAVADHINEATRAARFTRTGTRRSLLQWLTAPRRVLREGLIIRRDEALALAGKAKDAESLAKCVSASRIAAGIATPARA